MSGSQFLVICADVALVILLIAALLAIVRILRGPTMPDRILALDLLTTLGIGMVGAFALRSGLALYLDIAIALGLVGFLATSALARYVMLRAEAVRTSKGRAGR